MAILCPHCGAEFDVTLFQFGHGVRCDCGLWVDLRDGHVLPAATARKERVAMTETEIGKVSHYFAKIGVAAIEITNGSLSVGDTIHVKGHTSDFTQTVDSIQLDNEKIPTAVPGQAIGIKVKDHARQHDAVYKVSQ
jgi:translation initiation factor IF-2